MSLDDAAALKMIDWSGILALMERTPSRLTPPSDAATTYQTSLSNPENVVLAGVGGSGIAGDIVSDYCRAVTETPVITCRTMHIPKWVNKRTLFIAVSYSGQTSETLGQLDQAAKCGAELAAITSGGELLSRTKARVIPHLQIPANIPPRVALPELVAAVMFAVGSCGVLKDSADLLAKSATTIKGLIDQVKPGVPSGSNEAKRFATGLMNKLTLLIGDEEYGSVLRRFKNQINENAKMPAFYYTVPEGFHNDVEGLAVLAKLAKVQPVLLRTGEETDRQLRTGEHLSRVMLEMGFPPFLELKGIGQDRLSKLLTSITFGDYVSMYLAALRGTDPAELTLIPKFRSIMQG